MRVSLPPPPKAAAPRKSPPDQTAQPPAAPKLLGRALGVTTSLLATAVEIVLLTWLLLASG